MAEKNISYINQGFTDFKKTLIEYAKTYFPDTYNDFSEASPGMMFIEMGAVVGDVLGFYLDTQTQENIFLQTKEKENAIAMSYVMGYMPKMTYAAAATLDVYQLVPALNGEPDLNYALLIAENSVVTSQATNKTFITTEQVDFSSKDNVTASYYNDDFFILQTSVTVISSTIKSKTFNFTSPVKFDQITIIDDSIIQILDVYETEGDRWYEVPYLAQDTIFDETKNSSISNPFYSATDKVPYVLNLKKVPKRFTARFKDEKNLTLNFGAGVLNVSDESVIPNPNNVGLIPGVSLLDQNFNRASSVFTRQYGLAPSNTSLTVRYLVGGGVASNVPSNDLIEINKSGVSFKNIVMDLTDPIQSTIYDNITVNNPEPASGGRDGDTVEEIRQNALYSHTSQLRAVTFEDYVVRALSMPANLGNISKAWITQEFNDQTSYVNNNPLSMNMYVLAYDENKKLIQASDSLKNNLKTYLDKYRIATDAINIKNAYYINLGVNFDITVLNGYNNGEVLSNCIVKLKDFFSIDKFQLNQPIIISDIYSELLKVKGVQSVVKVTLSNISGTNYSPYGYDIEAATRNGVIYPSMDPSIFEVRFPDNDIKGRVITY